MKYAILLSMLLCAVLAFPAQATSYDPGYDDDYHDDTKEAPVYYKDYDDYKRLRDPDGNPLYTDVRKDGRAKTIHSYENKYLDVYERKKYSDPYADAIALDRYGYGDTSYRKEDRYINRHYDDDNDYDDRYVHRDRIQVRQKNYIWEEGRYYKYDDYRGNYVRIDRDYY